MALRFYKGWQTGVMAAKEWINWSGSLRFTPSAYLEPENEEELQDIVRKSYAAGRRIRVAAAGHSSSALVETSQTLLHLRHFKSVVKDKDPQTAVVGAGTTVHEANTALQEKGFALFNTGDVDVQTLAGAISTGTHGSGKKLQNLSSMLAGVQMIDYRGELKTFSDEQDPEIMKALRVSLGTMGIFTAITVKTVPLFKLRRLELCTDVRTCMSNFDWLAAENRNVDFYWYPRSDETKIRILNEPGNGTATFPFRFTLKDNEEGFVGKVLPRRRELKFDEMEYALPAAAGMECFREVRRRIKERHRKEVAWRVLYRIIAADDNYLSPHYGGDRVSISLHHNAGLPWEKYFHDIEPIFIAYGGRPHWGKKHNLRGEQLRRLYPDWDKFQSIRSTLDPEGFFMNNFLNELFEHYEHA